MTFQYGDVITEFESIANAFLEHHKTWQGMRKSTVKQLEDLADNLDEHHNNVNITNITASSVGVAGGVLAVAGGILSVFTLGAAAPLIVAGVSMSAASAATGVGASIAETCIDKSRCDEAQKVYNDDIAATEKIFERLKHVQVKSTELEENKMALQEWMEIIDEGRATAISGTVQKIGASMENADVGQASNLGTNIGKLGTTAAISVAAAVGKLGNVGAKVGKVGSVGVKLGKLGSAGAKMGKAGNLGASVAKAGATGFKVGGALLSGVGIGLDIWTIVSTAKDMEAGSKSPAGIQLRENVSKLLNQMKEIKQLFDSFVLAHSTALLQCIPEIIPLNKTSME